MQTLLNADQIQRLVADLASEMAADPQLAQNPAGPPALVGIRSRGEILAQRLAAELSGRLGAAGQEKSPIDLGALDITFYRDDLASRRAITIPQGTDMNFRLDDRPVVLVDDVLATGRSVRAALDALVDFGRPRIIRLAVLIDRGGREFPIAADFVGLQVPQTPPHQKIIVHLEPTDPQDAVLLD